MLGMGKQKQQRRSAKKKGGKKGEAVGQNDGTAEDMVKCTACVQLVKPEDTIACPILECNRVFCTKKCAKNCIVSCADPTCSMPKRCRPCASGKTLQLLQRRNKEPDGVHYAFTECERSPCKNLVCGECCFFCICKTCDLQVCVECCDSAGARDEQQAVVHCGSCSTNVCQKCDEGFNLSAGACSKCAFDAHCTQRSESNALFDDTSDDSYDESEDEVEESVSGSDELGEQIQIQAKICNEVVFIYAQQIRKALTKYAATTAIRRKLEEGSESTSVLNDDQESEAMYSSIVRKVAPDETIPDHVLKIGVYYRQKLRDIRTEMDGYESVGFDNLGKDALIHCLTLKYREEILIGVTPRKLSVFLLPDITSMLGAFHSMEKITSGLSRVELQKIHLDTMQDVYRKEACGYCLQPVPAGDATKRCGGCAAIRYCDKKCQALSWPVHREHCQQMNMARSEHNARLVEAAARGCERARCEATLIRSGAIGRELGYEMKRADSLIKKHYEERKEK